MASQYEGFPLWQISVVCFIRFAEPLAFTSLFPYIYFMIRDFGVVKDEAQISTYSGYLAASFALMQFIFIVQWGKMSDRVGRKRILLTGLLGTGVCMLLFGFSPNFYFAICVRGLMGALNGNVTILRTIIGELATERRHQGIAFATLPLFWNIGTVVGSLIGGSKYLTRPKRDAHISESLGSLHDRFLDAHPYALSNIVVALFFFLGALFGWLFLEETHPRVKSRRDIGLEIGDAIRRALGYDIPVRPWNRRFQRDPTERTLLLSPPSVAYSPVVDESDSNDDDASSISSSGPIPRRLSSAIIRRYSSGNLPLMLRTNTGNSVATVQSVGVFKAISDRRVFTSRVLLTISGNFFLGFHTLIYGEFLPVLLAGPFLGDELLFPLRLKGGFGFDANFIGTLFSTTGALGCLVIVVIFPVLDRNIKTVNGYRFACCIFPLVYTVVPFLIYTLPAYNPRFPEGLTTVLLYINSCVNTLATALAFPQIMMLIHRAAPPNHRTLINSFGLSMTSLARFVAPMVWGTMMTLFNTLGVGQVTWLVLAGISLVACFQSFYFMDEYDEQKAMEGGEA